MTNALAINQQTGEVTNEDVEYSRTGLVLNNDLSYEEWQKIGDKLTSIEGSIQWWIGDWLNYGERKYGEMYSQVLDAGNNYQTARDAKWVAGKFELSRRRDNVPFSHHKELAALEPKVADKLLDKCEEEGLSKLALRAEVIKIKHEKLVEAEIPKNKYRVFYVDPPWYYTAPQHGREEQETVLETHYPTMKIDELCALPVKNMAQDNAVLFMWVTSPVLDQCWDVIEAWGFEYKTSIVWNKDAHNVGHYVSVRHELLLICTRGSCTPDISELPPSVVTEKRTAHSVKPETFRKMIDTMYPKGKRIELFARRPAKGWDVWGNDESV
jgi:N6-adenosine-specific RNA methylase IME4